MKAKFAEDEVKKVKEESLDSIKKATIASESANGGIVDIITKAFAKSSGVQKEQVDNRDRVEAKIDTRAAQSDAAITSSRTAMQAGVEAGRKQAAPELKSNLKA